MQVDNSIVWRRITHNNRTRRFRDDQFHQKVYALPIIYEVCILLYLVNKSCNTGRIVQWFLIVLLEFDFTVVVKKGITHQWVDHLSRLINGEDPMGFPDDLPDAYLFFNVEMVPKWSKDIVCMFTVGSR